MYHKLFASLIAGNAIRDDFTASTMEDDFQEIVIDQDDEVQNYKFLKGNVPTKGEKDFEPDGTNYQSEKLQEAHEMMYNALSTGIKLHEKSLLQGVWVPEQSKTIILDIRGNFFKDLGVSGGQFKGKPIMWLNKLETLYLLERGSMIVYLSNGKFHHYLDGFINNFNFNELYDLNLQHFYSYFTSFELKKYQVFAYLKRLGYLVQDFKQFMIQTPLPKVYSIGLFSGRFNNMSQYNFNLKTHHYFSYGSIFEKLMFIPSYKTFDSLNYHPTSELEIHFNVWKPRPSFSKKNLIKPDFQICITDEFPSIQDIHYLFNKLNWEVTNELNYTRLPVVTDKRKMKPKPKPKPKSNNVPQDMAREKAKEKEKLRDLKLKYGTGRSIILAILDNGVNFINLSEVDFKLRLPDSDNCHSLYH